MKGLEYWSRETNPETGEKFEAWRKSLREAQDGTMDELRLLTSEYGDTMAQLAELRFRFEEDTMGEEILSFYKELGVRKEFFTGHEAEGKGLGTVIEGEAFYDRWMLFTPIEAPEDPDAERKYPLVFWNHGGGNAIETDEFATRFSQMVGKEKFILVILQDTRWQTISSKIDEVAARYPVDKERIYVSGYSQGGQATHSALLRIPEKLAAAVPSGAEIFQQWDHLDIKYTVPEVLNLRRCFVPTMLINGVSEFLAFLPVNHYRPVQFQPHEEGSAISLYQVPGHDRDADPTNPPGKRADKPFPPEGASEEEADRWKLGRLNLRMFAQHCKERDEEVCLGYRKTSEDVLHHKLGFYGDREETRVIGGVEHYIADMFHEDGTLAFRYCGIDNYPHWHSPYLAELAWEFMRMYRRDSATGKIAVDRYEA